jgi:hypothetical protein
VLSSSDTHSFQVQHLRILSLWGASCCVMYTYTFQIYLRSQLRIYWCYLLFSLFTTCFGPYGPSSGEIQQHKLHILKKRSILQQICCFTICNCKTFKDLRSSQQSLWTASSSGLYCCVCSPADIHWVPQK